MTFLKQHGAQAVKEVCSNRACYISIMHIVSTVPIQLQMLSAHNLRPGAFRFPVKLTDEVRAHAIYFVPVAFKADALNVYPPPPSLRAWPVVKATDAEFAAAVKAFEAEAPLAAAAGFNTAAMHLLPWSCTDMPFGLSTV